MSKTFTRKDGDGVLFKNDDRKNDRAPNYRGNILINGQEYWLSGWLKESKSGDKYMSLSAQPKQAQYHHGAAKNPPAQRSNEPDLNDDIPWQ